MIKSFPFYKQLDEKDCGPTCLKMIAKYHGLKTDIQALREHSETTREGSELLGLAQASEKLGFRSIGVKIDYLKLKKEAPLPAILFWENRHFIVLYKIKDDIAYIADPGHGLIKLSKSELIKGWIDTNATESTKEGVALLLQPSPKLSQPDLSKQEKGELKFLFKYLLVHKKFLLQLIIGLASGSLLQLIFPFLTQSIVDIGIQNQDINFIYLILIAQITLFVGRTAIEIIRGWVLHHLSTRINIALISDFFIKLMNLPISFFDTRMTGDIMQRINDHRRIESLLTTSSLNVLFSMVNLFIFGSILAWYDFKIFNVFFIGSIIYFLWVIIFLKRRKDLDYKRFSQLSNEQSKVMELINGMQEIKLHNAEKQKRWGWEILQASLFKISIKSLSLEQTQAVGSNFINEIKNIIITVLSAQLVINGDITLGMMMSISYIIGQLNSPINQLIGFVYSVQDAKIAIERLSEIHNKEDEEPLNKELTTDFSLTKNIVLSNIHYRYIGSSKMVLDGINLSIPPNKTTAIVGHSGSGKTTLLKMLLKFYEPNKGGIKVGNTELNSISHQNWRSNCGVVMQEGYIFNDTIANNIAIGQSTINKERLEKAVTTANIKDFIEDLPLGYNTKIGQEGTGLSTGQKQRLLIARAIYKDPQIILFDEATSSLDAKNEKVIMENLNHFLSERTAIVIAHRLSTVKNADQIVVMDKGKIIEKGTHTELLKQKGSYYELVKNQLELS